MIQGVVSSQRRNQRPSRSHSRTRKSPKVVQVEIDVQKEIQECEIDSKLGQQEVQEVQQEQFEEQRKIMQDVADQGLQQEEP